MHNKANIVLQKLMTNIVLFQFKTREIYYLISANNRMNHFFSFFPVYRAKSEIPLTAITLKRIPGISPFDLPFLPKPATKT